jgi:hypothetical protein
MARSGFEQVRRSLYKTQRLMGDAEAAQRGPAVLGRRLARRDLTRAFFRVLRQMSR